MSQIIPYRGYRIVTKPNGVNVYDSLNLWVLTAEDVNDAMSYIDSLIELFEEE